MPPRIISDPRTDRDHPRDGPTAAAGRENSRFQSFSNCRAMTMRWTWLVPS
jgi:hypothetical protein